MSGSSPSSGSWSVCFRSTSCRNVGVPAGLQGLETLCGKQAQMILNPEAPVWVCMGGCGLGVGADCETGHFPNSFFSVECVC